MGLQLLVICVLGETALVGTQGGREGADRGNQSGPGRKFLWRKSLAPPKRFCNIAPWRQRGSLHPDLSSPIPVTEVAFGGISIRDKQGGFARVSSGFSVCQLFYFTFIAVKQAQHLPRHSLKFFNFHLLETRLILYPWLAWNLRPISCVHLRRDGSTGVN